ncbi:hypothetical protein AAG570_012232 [Ranatra chinensis]|uniref:Uncharacterized protein n=1 Tax=Ranatra chinensis TaxID=642074 RepID=A0ABD0YI69_9HEMI
MGRLEDQRSKYCRAENKPDLSSTRVGIPSGMESLVRCRDQVQKVNKTSCSLKKVKVKSGHERMNLIYHPQKLVLGGGITVRMTEIKRMLACYKLTTNVGILGILFGGENVTAHSDLLADGMDIDVFLKNGGPDGVVVSMLDHHAMGPEFDSLREDKVADEVMTKRKKVGSGKAPQSSENLKIFYEQSTAYVVITFKKG